LRDGEEKKRRERGRREKRIIVEGEREKKSEAGRDGRSDGLSGEGPAAVHLNAFQAASTMTLSTYTCR
jgi:hypothetical protein